MKVAIASSGLGHITRGIETWAADTATALHRQGIDVTLFAAAPLDDMPLRTIVLPCLKRNGSANRAIVRMAPRWAWRWHLKSTYEIEQWSFWHHLQKHIRADQYDILHVQDPLLAALAQNAFQNGRLACRCILAHGTEEPASYLQQFTYLQHLAPWHMQQTLLQCSEDAYNATSSPFPGWIVLPNFVDTTCFHPVHDTTAKHAIRARLALPPDAVIWGTAAAIKTHHKRINWLIEEFAQAAAKRDDLHLVIAGSRQQDTEALIECAQKRCPNRITFAINHPHQQMPDLLRALDAFVLTSLFEMMPIALLEAISTGLPAFTHDHPVLAWMAGPGGKCIKMDRPGSLANTISTSSTATLQALGRQAREHAVATFSIEQVIPAYIAYYHHVLQTTPSTSSCPPQR